jgi:hypothetical protein
VERAWQQPVAHGQHHLQHARHPGGGLGVPEVRLDRTQVQRGVPVAAVGGEQRLGLDGVAERRTGAVRLDDVDILCGQSGVGERLGDHPLLRWSVGGGEAVGRAVLVHRGTTQHGEDRVAEALRGRQRSDEQYPDALGESGAVRALGEGLAAAVG